MLFDSGAEVSILDTTFSHKGCVIDERQTQECVEGGESADFVGGVDEDKDYLGRMVGVLFRHLGR